MELSVIFNVVKEYVPIPVIVATVSNIMLVYGSTFLVSIIEEYLEENNGKQYRFFDGKKVWLSVFWCIVLSITLALAKFIEWREMPFYLFVILGASTFLYEAFLKKIGVKKENA